jgi:hypothetical protein
MYYLINNDSQLTIAQQIGDTHDILHNVHNAMRRADALKAQTGDNWEVIQIKSVYTTQTLDEAHREALDVPHMGRD